MAEIRATFSKKGWLNCSLQQESQVQNYSFTKKLMHDILVWAPNYHFHVNIQNIVGCFVLYKEDLMEPYPAHI